MKIFVYERPDGSQGADYSEAYCRHNGKIVATHELNTRRDMEALARDGESPRIKALATRALKEFLARNQQPEPQVTWSPAMATVKDRRFMGRLKWLLTGR